VQSTANEFQSENRAFAGFGAAAGADFSVSFAEPRHFLALTFGSAFSISKKPARTNL
jgi:hypothetical protein